MELRGPETEDFRPRPEGFQERRAGINRASGERWRLAVFFLAAVVITSVFSFSRSEFFAVADIHVVGAKHVPARHIVELSGISLGQNLFEADCRRAAARIRSDPRITTCRVTRSLPDTVRIEVSERAAVAVIPYVGYFFELDREGRAIAFHRTLQDVSLPLVGGVVPRQVELGQIVTALSLGKVLEVASLLSSDMAGQVSEIAWTEGGTLELYTVDGIRIHMGAPEDLPRKVQVLERMLAEIEPERRLVRYIDLSVAMRPTVRMRPGADLPPGSDSAR